MILFFIGAANSSLLHAGIFGLSTFEKGKNAHAKKDFGNAEKLYQQALLENPNDNEVLYHLALAQYHAKNFESAQTNTTAAITNLKKQYFYFENSRKKLLINLYRLEAHILYNNGDLAGACKSFESALDQNAFELDHDQFVIITENLSFVYDLIAKNKKSLETVLLPKERKNLDSSLVLLKEEASDLSLEAEHDQDSALTLNIEFPSFSEANEPQLTNSNYEPADKKVNPKMNLEQIQERQEELKVKLKQHEETKAERQKAKDEDLKQQSKSAEAQEMEDEKQDWNSSQNESKQIPEESDIPESESKSGMEEANDDKNYFKIIPYEGREYATAFFDRFDTQKGIWRADASEKFLNLRKAFEWDNTPNSIAIEGQGYIYKDQNPKITLPVREGYAIDPESIRFENNNAKSYLLKRGSIGTYILHIRGSGLNGSRFAFKLRKLAKAANAEAKPSPYDTEEIVKNIPDTIRTELDIRLKGISDTESRARAIEAYILRRAIYTDNNEPGARDITPFIDKNGKDAQNRFNQMARILNQKEDLNFPKELIGVGLNCDLWSDFYIALARYYKVPTRKVIGFYNRFPKDSFLNGAERHAWVSVWSEKKAYWVWLEPTPRGGLTDEQQDRLDEDEIASEAASLEWLSAMKEKKEEAPIKDPPPPADKGKGAGPDAPPEAPMDEEFDWIMFTDPAREGELSPEQRAKLKQALEAYTQKENEYRLQRKSKTTTAAERLFEAMKIRNELLPQETKMISSFQKAAKVFNVLSVKKDLSPKELDFIARYKQSRDQLLKYALTLLARPKHDPQSDSAMLTNEILHALALIEPIIKFDPDDPKDRYKKLLALAEQHLARTKPEALLEYVAENDNFYLINGGKSLYIGAKNGFSFEKVDFDPSPYTEISLGTLTPDGKHYALVAAIGETLYLIRDGKRTVLPYNEAQHLTFADENAETLISYGVRTTETGYYSLNVTTINDAVFNHTKFFNIQSPQKGKLQLGVWHDNVFDHKGSDVIVSSHLLVNGKKYINPKTQKPYELGPQNKFAGSSRAFALDDKNFLVSVEETNDRYGLKINFEEVLLPAVYSYLYIEADSKSGLPKITASNFLTKKYEYYYYENNKLVPFTPEETKKDPNKIEYRLSDTNSGKSSYFSLDDKPLILEDGRRVIVKDGPHAFGEENHPYYRIQNYHVTPNSHPLDRYLISHLFTLDPERAMLKPVKTYDARGNLIEFDLIDNLRTIGDKYTFFALKGKSIYLVRNGQIDGSIPPQRADMGAYDPIRGSIDVDKQTDYVFWTTGGSYFPFTAWIDNVPLISHSNWRSVYIYEPKLEKVKDLIFKVERSRGFRLLNKESIAERIENLRCFIIDQNPEEFFKRSQTLLAKKQLVQTELLYLIRNTHFHSSTDSALIPKNLEENKKKIIENAIRIPSLPMTRKERVNAILSVIKWRAEYKNSNELMYPELDALAEAALQNNIGDAVIEVMKEERESDSWRFLTREDRLIKNHYYKQAVFKSGKPDPLHGEIYRDW